MIEAALAPYFRSDLWNVVSRNILIRSETKLRITVVVDGECVAGGNSSRPTGSFHFPRPPKLTLADRRDIPSND